MWIRSFVLQSIISAEELASFNDVFIKCEICYYAIVKPGSSVEPVLNGHSVLGKPLKYGDKKHASQLNF